jgi:uncharacterized membrane protein YccC
MAHATKGTSTMSTDNTAQQAAPRKKWHQVSIGGPAAVGILVGIGAGMFIHPLLGILGWILTTAALVALRIWLETRLSKRP